MHRFSISSRLTTLAAPPLTFALLTVLSGCRSDANTAPQSQPPQVSVAAALEREVVQSDDFTGRLEAVESVQIRPRVNGYIESVHFEEGGVVRKGDLLFVIDPRPYRADRAKAEAELARATARAELANADAARSEKLLAIKAVSQEEYDQRVNASREAEASVAAARAALETAKLNLQFTRITAPITGRIGKAEVTAGNLVSVGATLLTTIVSIDPMYVTFEGDEHVYLTYAELARRGVDGGAQRARNTVLMALTNESGYPHRGEIVFVDNRIDPRTGTIRARAAFDNQDGYLTPGLFARVKLLGNESRRAVLVDDSAIGVDQHQRFVYVLNEDDAVAYRSIRTGRLSDGLRIVLEGLAPGERVIVNGLQRVQPGVVVAPQMVAMDPRERDPQDAPERASSSLALAAAR